jgi:hypothetical protein
MSLATSLRVTVQITYKILQWGRRKGQEMKYNGEVNLFKAQCILVRNYHNEIPLYY